MPLEHIIQLNKWLLVIFDLSYTRICKIFQQTADLAILYGPNLSLTFLSDIQIIIVFFEAKICICSSTKVTTAARATVSMAALVAK